MFSSIISLWASFKTWIALAGIACLAFAAIYLTGRSHGASSVEQELTEDLLENVQDQKEIRDETSSLTDDALRERLHKWTKG